MPVFEARSLPPVRDLVDKIALVTIALAAMALSLAVVGGWSGVAVAVLVPIVAAIAVIDARHFIIPDELNAAGIALGLALAAIDGLSPMDGLIAAAFRASAFSMAFLVVRVGYRALRGRQGLGLGDVKLAGLAGAWLAWEAIPIAIEIAALTALLVYGLRQWRAGKALRADERLPFGVFFAPAIWIALILHHAFMGEI